MFTVCQVEDVASYFRMSSSDRPVASTSARPVRLTAPTIAESFVVTAPDVTVNLLVSNDAMPLFDVVASSPAIVSVVHVAEVSIPSPPAIVRLS